jgi:hypothetical protein
VEISEDEIEVVEENTHEDKENDKEWFII